MPPQGTWAWNPAIACASLEDCEREARGDITVESGAAGIALAGRQPHAHKAPGQRHAGTAGRGGVLPGQAGGDAAAPCPLPGHALRWNPTAKESPGGCATCRSSCGWPAPPASATAGARWPRPACSPRPEARDLRRAEQAFKRLRIELHLLTGRREDRVLFDTATGLAAVYGIASTATRRTTELLMQRYYWARAPGDLAQCHPGTEHRGNGCSAPDSDARLIDDDFRNLRERLDIVREDGFERNPTLLLRASLVMQQHPELDRHVGPHAARHLAFAPPHRRGLPPQSGQPQTVPCRS